MRVSVKYRYEGSPHTAERDFDSIKAARKYAKELANSSVINKVWIAKFDTWHWYIYETVKEKL